jgi:A/G-specific adenine glycosylase
MNDRSVVTDLLRWFARNARDLPWRETHDPYAIWVSEIMLQQTQVKTVLPYWKRWMRQLPTIAAVAKARPQKLHKLWEGLGYYTRVRNLQKAAKRVVEVHGGRFPQDFDKVLELPGIGRYTAGAICSIAFNQPTPILDGNVIRVLTRVAGIGGDPRARETNARLWCLAERLVRLAARNSRPGKRRLSSCGHGACSQFNQALMELGALICTPRQPRCTLCPIESHCVACRQGRTCELPALARRAATTRCRFVAIVAQRGARFLVRQRPAGVVNAHLWEFPNLELDEGQTDPERAARVLLGVPGAALTSFCRVKHSITRYRITLDAYCLEEREGGKAAVPRGRWLTLRQLNRLSFTAAHKKILERLLNGV